MVVRFLLLRVTPLREVVEICFWMLAVAKRVLVVM
jgi:hypothetical protein